MQEERDNKKLAQTAGSINAQSNIGAEVTQMEKMHASQGHGFAAERANHLYDVLQGKNAVILGDNNAKNGADRMVDGMLIQSKYCQTASRTVSEAFENNQYRYLTPDGQPMQLEVPSDQYQAAIEAMEQRIIKGEVPNVTDPQQAKEIVRRGHFTYNQAQRLAQSNTIESLSFDAVNGTVVAANAFGITATITFALSCWNGNDLTTSIENAVCAGMQVGGASFITSIAANQLARAGMNRALAPATDELVKTIGSKSANIIATAMQSNANIYGQTAMNNVAKLIRGNVVSGAIMTVVLSAKDIGNAFRGRISTSQLIKNTATTAGGMAGGTGGMVVGTAIAGPLGGVVGALAGGMIGGTATNKITGAFIKDDSEKLISIIEKEFLKYVEEEVLSAEETELVLTELSDQITSEKLMEMHASHSKVEFAHKLIRESGNRIIGFRHHIMMPTNLQMLEGMQYLSDDYEKGTGIFGKENVPSVVDIGKQLTGIEYSDKVAKRAWYATKQINAVQKHTENILRSMQKNERYNLEELSEVREFNIEKKKEFEELLNGGEN